MIKPELLKILKDNNYLEITDTETEHGIVALEQWAYTCSISCDLDMTGRAYRYCFHNMLDALSSLYAWRSVDFEGHPPGPWIKRKGLGEDLRREDAYT